MSFCPSCGRGVVEGAQFCAGCGAPLQAPVPAYTTAPAAALTAPAQRVRPTGVAILAILQMIGAGFAALGGLFLLFGGSAIASAGAASGNEFGEFFGGAFGVVLAFVGVFLLVFAAVGFLVGYGLWAGKGWARIVAIVLAAMGLLSGAVGLVGAATEDVASVVVQLLFVAFYGFLLWYWTRPGVKAFFESQAPIR